MLIELLRQYEDRSLSSPLWKSGWDEITSDKERYKLYLGYLTELTKLMFEKCDSVDVYQTINPKTENANPNSGIEFSLAPVYLISRMNYGYVSSQNGWLPYYSECIICYDGNYLITTGYASEDYYKTRQWKTKKEEKTGSMDVDSLRIIVAAVSSQLSYVRSDFSGVCDASSIDIEQFDINGVIQKRFYGFGCDEPVATIAKLLPSLNS